MKTLITFILFNFGIAFSIPQRLDNQILIPDQKTGRILILKADLDADWNNPSSILWSFNVKRPPGLKGKDRRAFRKLFPRLNDAKRVRHEGRDYIIICGNGGDGIAMIDVITKQVVYYTNAGGDPHAIALLPDRSMVVSMPKRGGVALFRTDRNNNSAIQKTPHAGTHGLVWDKQNQLLWSWGGKNMKAYSYNGRLKFEKNYRIPLYGGGHDLAPKLETREMFLAHNGGISTFNVDTKQFTVFKLGQAYKNPKGLSYFNGELIYVRPDKKVTKLRNRSHRVRSFTSKDRTTTWGGWYKARWFTHNTFSY